ncbi:hypothetical protein JCM3765_006489 [Sporobolomyces pararoseus]
MNSLPPELLSSIVDLAADCSSIYDSWNTRMETLLALTLVNKVFHGIAQPLLPQKFFFKEDDNVVGEPFEDFMRSGVTAKIESLTFEPKFEAYYYKLPMLLGFENVTELKVKSCADMSLQTFEAHQRKLLSPLAGNRVGWALLLTLNSADLSRITLYEGNFHYDADTDADISQRSLTELTLEDISIIIYESHKEGATPPLLSESHFPSLRALGLKDFRGRFRLMDQIVFSASLIARLDCLSTDDKSIPTAARDLPIPAPFLLDKRVEESLDDDVYSPYVLGSLSPSPSPSHTHLRIRLPCEPIPSSQDIKSALESANNLVKDSINIEELYLDLYPRDGRRDYVLEKELEKQIKKLEDTARKKNVEIIWENHEDDWCGSRVSKEFWRRCKAKKEKEKS